MSDPSGETTLKAGNQDSPNHDAWLAALGRATYACSCLAGIAFDLLRVLGSHDSASLYNDPLGRLESKLQGFHKHTRFPEMDIFMTLLGPAIVTRNDLLHALPVRDGLHRRSTRDPYYVRDFFTVESLDAVTAECLAASRAGGEALYRDGGAAVRAWYEKG